MVNQFTVKKYAVLIIFPILTTCAFMIGNMFYKFLGGLGFMAGFVLMSVLIGNLLLRNPFTQMLEGQGLLAIDLNSTGIIRPFIITVHKEYIKGKVAGEEMKDIFDRDAVMQMQPPQKIGEYEEIIDKAGKRGIQITMGTDDFNLSRFQLYHYPVILYNSQIKSILTKDYLAEKEKESFTEHGLLYLNRKMEDLTSVVRDFGRYVVETLKPKESIFGSKWFWIILIGALIILGLLFAPAIINAIKGVGSSGAATNVKEALNSGQTIIPRG